MVQNRRTSLHELFHQDDIIILHAFIRTYLIACRSYDIRFREYTFIDENSPDDQPYDASMDGYLSLIRTADPDRILRGHAAPVKHSGICLLPSRRPPPRSFVPACNPANAILHSIAKRDAVQPCRSAALSDTATQGLLPERAKWNETRNHAFVTCQTREPVMNNIIYIVGLVVVVLAVLSFFGLR